MTNSPFTAPSSSILGLAVFSLFSFLAVANSSEDSAYSFCSCVLLSLFAQSAASWAAWEIAFMSAPLDAAMSLLIIGPGIALP